MDNPLANLLTRLAAGIPADNGAIAIPLEVSGRMTERQLDLVMHSIGKKDEEEPWPDARDFHREWAKQNKIPDWLEPEVWKSKQDASADS